MKCKRWEIWWADVKYEDAPTTIESRPVIVVAPQEVCFIAFKMTGTKRIHDYEIKKWSEAGLTKATYIRKSPVFVANTGLVSWHARCDLNARPTESESVTLSS